MMNGETCFVRIRKYDTTHEKLRAEIALGRETLDEFEDLLAAQAAENEFLPWKTADAANHYISEHNRLIETHAVWLWNEFMKEHGQKLIQILDC